MSLLKLFKPTDDQKLSSDYNMIYIPGSKTVSLSVQKSDNAEPIYDYRRVRDDIVDAEVAFNVLSRFADHYGFSDDNFKIHQKLNEIGDMFIDILKEKVSPNSNFKMVEKSLKTDD